MQKDQMIYLVINCGDVKFASYEESEVDEFIDTMNYRSMKEASDDYGYDLESDSGVAAAQWQSGYDGGFYEKAEVHSDKLLGDDEEVIVSCDSGDIAVISDEIDELLDISVSDALEEYDNQDDQ